MEIGNLIFGNSCGEFPIERGVGWEDELIRLFDTYAPDRDNSWREYGVLFENDIFSIFPYYWGECTCGYVEKEARWCEDNKHNVHCYQSKLAWEEKEWLTKNPEPETTAWKVEKIESGITTMTKGPATEEWSKWVDRKRKAESRIYNKLCTEFGLDSKFGCAVHCTCDYKKRWQLFRAGSDHAKDCPIVKPNFLYKPSDFSIKWYKYPLRDSYKSQDITLDQFRVIISECIESLAYRHLALGTA